MKTWLISFKFLVLISLLTGIVYPLLITAITQTVFHAQANGSLVYSSGQKKGSALISQAFKEPRYFWPRPSGVDFNPMPSGGTNLGPTSQDLLAKVKERTAAGAVQDLLFASGSGLDPHISPRAAMSQVTRISKARGVPEATLSSIVRQFTEKRQLGFLGEERVNVLLLNLALDQK